MQHETELIVKAIESLQQQTNYFKDYIFPIASAFFSSILGAAIAYFTLKDQENIQFEKHKLDVANECILKFEEARATLLSIKANYHGKLNTDPVQRVAAIRSIIIREESLTINYHDLSFIVPSKKDVKSSEFPKWSQIPLIRGIVKNYNLLLKMWEFRNDKNQSYNEELLNHYGDKPFLNLQIEEIIKNFGQTKLVVLIDLNEQVINLTDCLLKEIDNFLFEFPKYMKKKINIKRLKHYGSILSYSENSQKITDLLHKSPEPDFSKIEELFGETAKEIEKRYKTRYEF